MPNFKKVIYIVKKKMSLYKLPFIGKKTQQRAKQDGGATECWAANKIPS